MIDFNDNSEKIQSIILNDISNEYEKTKGNFLWDITKSIGIAFKELLKLTKSVKDSLDIDNLTGEELEKAIFRCLH